VIFFGQQERHVGNKTEPVYQSATIG